VRSEHDTQSDSARNAAKRPPKQSITSYTASRPTSPATATTTAAAAAAAVAPTIIHSPFLSPHITTIAGGAIPFRRRRYTNIELIAHLVEKSDEHDGFVSSTVRSM